MQWSFFYGVPLAVAESPARSSFNASLTYWTIMPHRHGAHVPQKDRRSLQGLPTLSPLLSTPILYSDDSEPVPTATLPAWIIICCAKSKTADCCLGKGVAEGSLFLATDSCKFGQLRAAGCSRSILAWDQLWLILFIGCFGFGPSRKIRQMNRMLRMYCGRVVRLANKSSNW